MNQTKHSPTKGPTANMDYNTANPPTFFTKILVYYCEVLEIKCHHYFFSSIWSVDLLHNE